MQQSRLEIVGYTNASENKREFQNTFRSYLAKRVFEIPPLCSIQKKNKQKSRLGGFEKFHLSCKILNEKILATHCH